jgi:hypothetical protein
MSASLTILPGVAARIAGRFGFVGRFAAVCRNLPGAHRQLVEKVGQRGPILAISSRFVEIPSGGPLKTFAFWCRWEHHSRPSKMAEALFQQAAGWVRFHLFQYPVLSC